MLVCLVDVFGESGKKPSAQTSKSCNIKRIKKTSACLRTEQCGAALWSTTFHQYGISATFMRLLNGDPAVSAAVWLCCTREHLPGDLPLTFQLFSLWLQMLPAGSLSSGGILSKNGYFKTQKVDFYLKETIVLFCSGWNWWLYVKGGAPCLVFFNLCQHLRFYCFINWTVHPNDTKKVASNHVVLVLVCLPRMMRENGTLVVVSRELKYL